MQANTNKNLKENLNASNYKQLQKENYNYKKGPSLRFKKKNSITLTFLSFHDVKKMQKGEMQLNVGMFYINCQRFQKSYK